MSVKATSFVWQLPLRHSQKIVLLAIADCANDEGFAYPGYKTLIKKTGLSRTTLSKNISILCQVGLLEKSPHAEIGKGRKVNTYTISIRGELTVSMRCELIEKIKEIESSNSRAISPVLAQRKVQSSHTVSTRTGHETSVEPSVKQTSEKTDYPNELNIDAWLEYLDYRKQARFKKLTPMGEAKQIENLIKLGDHVIQKKCIDKTIANGWQGIFSLKKSDSGSSKKNTRQNWYESLTGIETKAKELGVLQGDNEPFPYFKARVFKAAGMKLQA